MLRLNAAEARLMAKQLGEPFVSPKGKRRYVCERCGGTGVEPEGHWTGKAYDSKPGGDCTGCGGKGKLGAVKGKRPKAGKSKLEEELLRQIELAGIPAPVTEYRFDPVRRWRLDMVWLFATKRSVAVEIHGGIWVKSRHTTGAGFHEDCQKRNAVAAAGIRLIEVCDKDIKNGSALRWIQEALQ